MGSRLSNQIEWRQILNLSMLNQSLQKCIQISFCTFECQNHQRKPKNINKWTCIWTLLTAQTSKISTLSDPKKHRSLYLKSFEYWCSKKWEDSKRTGAQLFRELWKSKSGYKWARLFSMSKLNTSILGWCSLSKWKTFCIFGEILSDFHLESVISQWILILCKASYVQLMIKLEIVFIWV